MPNIRKKILSLSCRAMSLLTIGVFVATTAGGWLLVPETASAAEVRTFRLFSGMSFKLYSGKFVLYAPATPAAEGGGPATIAYVDTANSASDLTTYDFTVDIGTAAADRYVLVGIFGARVGGSSISSVTINGVSASVVSDGITQASALASGGIYLSALWIANVPTGSTDVTVSVTFTEQQLRAAVSTWEMTNLSNAGVATNVAIDTEVNNGEVSAAVTTLADGVGVGFAVSGTGASPTATWTGLTEDFDVQFDSRGYTGAAFAPTTGVNIDAVCDFSAASAGAASGVFVSFN